MNIFALAVIILFIGASGVELFKGNSWMALFYGCSALINLAVLMGGVK